MKLLAVILTAGCLLAQDMSSVRSVVRAQGSATVVVQPDQMQVDIGVVTQAQTAQAASAANAKQLGDVIAELKRIAGPSAEVRTVNFSVQPNYRYPKDGGAPTITGYSATNVVQVVSSDVKGAGKIIDAATKTGANTIQGIQFSVKDEQPVRAQALAQATKQARASAEAMAMALGMKVTRVVRIEDAAPTHFQPVREMAQMRMAAQDAAVPPMEPGTIRVTANVAVTLEIAP
jgi:uncharacterized protein YggE